MGIACKPTGKFRGMLHKIEIEDMKRKEEKNRAGKSQKKETN